MARASPRRSRASAFRRSNPPRRSEHARHRVLRQRRSRARLPGDARQRTGPGRDRAAGVWGIEEHIRSVCDRLAAEGFYALAPDLYGGETTTQPSEAEQKATALSMDTVEPQMCAAAD